MSQTQTQALTVTSADQYAVMNFDAAELAEIVRDNLGDEPLKVGDFDTVTVPLGGNTQWSVPTLEGDEDLATLEGVILHSRAARGYWKAAFGAASGPPDCRSDDGVWGEGTPGGQCAICPMAKFGADGTERPACRLRTEVFLLRPDSLMPTVVRVPPTSIKQLRAYTRRLTSAGIRQSSVTTTLSLQKVKAEGAKPAYSLIVPKIGSRLTPEQAAKVTAYAREIRPLLSTPLHINELGSLPGDDGLMSADEIEFPE